MNSPGTAHHVGPGEGRSVDLGVVSMRLVAGGETTGRQYTLAEFHGTSGGAWTLPHVHEGFEESFFVLDGHFTFTVDGEAIEAGAGSYVLVPHGTAHTIEAADGGGRFLTLMVPGGLEEMFFELGTMPADAIRDPAARARVAERYDSVPVTA